MERVRIAITLDDADEPRQVSVTWFNHLHDTEGISVIPIGPFDRATELCATFCDELWAELGLELRGIQGTLPFE